MDDFERVLCARSAYMATHLEAPEKVLIPRRVWERMKERANITEFAPGNCLTDKFCEMSVVPVDTQDEEMLRFE